jgi:hypothetical protein
VLNSEDCLQLLHTLVFWDSERPITIDLLRRIDLTRLARRLGVEPAFSGVADHTIQTLF